MQNITNTRFLFILIVYVSSIRSALGNVFGDPHNSAVNDDPSDQKKKMSILSDTHESPCSHTQHTSSPQSINYSCCKPYCKKHLSGLEKDGEDDYVDHRDVLYFKILQ